MKFDARTGPKSARVVVVVGMGGVSRIGVGDLQSVLPVRFYLTPSSRVLKITKTTDNYIDLV